MRKAGNKIGALPFTVVLDSKQVICFRKTGALSLEDMARIAASCRCPLLQEKTI